MQEHIINTPIKDLPPSGSDFFRIHVFPFIVIQKDKQRLAVHWTWKNKPFSLFIQKVEENRKH